MQKFNGPPPLVLEYSFANENAKRLNHPSYLRWKDCKSSHRFMVWANKQLVHYTVKNGVPVDITKFKVVSFSADNEQGMRTNWLSSNGDKFTTTTMPLEVIEGCFLYSPKVNEVRYVEVDGIDVQDIQWSMCYKVPHNPKLKVEGGTTLCEEAQFKFMFGEHV